MEAVTGKTPATEGRPSKRLSIVNGVVPALLAVSGSLATESVVLAGVALGGAILIAVLGLASYTWQPVLKGR